MKSCYFNNIANRRQLIIILQDPKYFVTKFFKISISTLNTTTIDNSSNNNNNNNSCNNNKFSCDTIQIFFKFGAD